MSGPVVYWNGDWVRQSAAAVPLYDAGFVMGATVTEQLRTFGGEIFRAEEHIRRLFRSLEIVGVDPGLTSTDFEEIGQQLVRRNLALGEPDDDLGLAMLVTPGPYATLAPPDTPLRPLVCLHTYPLPFHIFAGKYRTGESLAVPSVRQVATDCWPRELKCRSRMHYFLADREAARSEPGARAAILDHDGFLLEATTASILVYFADEGLVTPPGDKVLPGISISVVRELADRLGIAVVERDLHPDEAGQAEEILLASTTSCLLPVVRFKGEVVANGRPGAIFGRLLQAWNELVGVDIAGQAEEIALRRARQAPDSP
jgi:branched-chain amino acid aminotransferase